MTSISPGDAPAPAPAATGTPAAPSGGDWRLRLPEPRRRIVRGWLWSIAGMTLGVLMVGGITRLTQSGLSIVDWDPLMGVIPPLDEAQWDAMFARYQEFPEYRKLRQGMSLDEFKLIFFWEYLHRLLARGIGLVFLVPFLVFWLRGWLDRPLLLRTLALFGLGAAQGVMGWLMVASGLVDRPSVSHFRLAAHLSLAFLIFGFAVWLARELSVPSRDGPSGAGFAAALEPPLRRHILHGLAAVGALFGLQVLWGAFTAGLDAGFHNNTFPLMGGRLVPASLLWLDPAMANFVQNPVTVQWTHRVLGTVLGLSVMGLFLFVRRRPVDRLTRRFNATLLTLILAQYLLGVLTLVLAVPVPLGVAHQALAMVIFGVWVAWLHHARGPGAATRAGSTAPHPDPEHAAA